MKNFLSRLKMPLLIVALLSTLNMLAAAKLPGYRDLVKVFYYICLFLCCINGTYTIRTQQTSKNMLACLAVGATILLVEVLVRALCIFFMYPLFYAFSYGAHWGIIIMDLFLLYYLPSLPVVLLICYVAAKLYDNKRQSLLPLPKIR